MQHLGSVTDISRERAQLTAARFEDSGTTVLKLHPEGNEAMRRIQNSNRHASSDSIYINYWLGQRVMRPWLPCIQIFDW